MNIYVCRCPIRLPIVFPDKIPPNIPEQAFWTTPATGLFREQQHLFHENAQYWVHEKEKAQGGGGAEQQVEKHQYQMIQGQGNTEMSSKRGSGCMWGGGGYHGCCSLFKHWSVNLKQTATSLLPGRNTCRLTAPGHCQRVDIKVNPQACLSRKQQNH